VPRSPGTRLKLARAADDESAGPRVKANSTESSPSADGSSGGHLSLRRRQIPSRSRLISSVVFVAASAVAVAYWQGSIFALRGAGVAVVIAVVIAQFPDRDSWAAVIACFVLAYFGGRIAIGNFSAPWNMFYWWPYFGGGLSLAIVIQAFVLEALCPFRVENFAGPRNLLAALLIAGAYFVWRRLEHGHGPASTAFIVAIILFGAMTIAAVRWSVLPGIALVAVFLGLSALAQVSGPEVLEDTHPGATFINFELKPAIGDEIDTRALDLDVYLNPGAPSLFGCPSHVSVYIFVVASITGRRRHTLTEQLARARYELSVTGATKISDDRSGLSTPFASRVIPADRFAEGPHTVYAGHGLDIEAPTGDSFEFNLPLQTPRMMGSCWISVPGVDAGEPIISGGYFESPGTATVDLQPPLHTDVDVSNTAPRPVRKVDDPGDVTWTCTRGYGQGSGNCPAVAVVTATWSSAYVQTVLIVVGALAAIAAERWFRLVEPPSH
jgi:hypothetical protein